MICIRQAPGSGWRLLVWAALALCLLPARAAYVKRYTTIANGAMTFTGNTLGLDKNTSTSTGSNGGNGPGTTGSIGTFITTLTSAHDTTPTPGYTATFTNPYNAGTTAAWASNRSKAQLRMPAGSTVLYAELVWGGCYQTTNENVSSSYNGYVVMAPPTVTYNASDATQQLTPDSATTGTNFTLTGSGRYYYVRAREVTSIVQQYGAGMYEVGHVPGTQDSAETNANACGWTLCVIYRNPSLPARNLTLFLGCELTDTNQQPISSVTGFCTPSTGAVNGRLLACTIEGDANITGDGMKFGATTPPANTLSSTMNPANNFFNSRICYYDPDTNTLTVDTAGTYGTLNHSPGAPVSGGRQGWDITNVDVSSYLSNSQSTAYAQGTTTQDRYTITAMGLQINVGAPVFSNPTLVVNKTTTYVGDTLTYTATLSNATGTADATNVVFSNHGPNGLSFVPGSVTVNGVAQPSANVENGVAVGTIAKTAQATVVFRYHVDFIPPGNPGQYSDNCSWTYQYLSCPGFPLNNGSFVSNTVVSSVPKLTFSKANAPTTVLALNDTVQYTLTITNSGAIATSGATLRDPIPQGLTYVADSTYLNGTQILGATMPFASEREIHGPGDAAGVIAVGKTATLVFTCRCTSPQPVITNTAYLDPDGNIANSATPQTAVVYNPAQSADLGVAITDGKTNATAGTTNLYTITLTNNSGNTVTNCTLLFTHSDGTLGLNYVPSTGTYDGASGSWTGLNLAAGQSVTLAVNAQIFDIASGTLTGTATVTGPPGFGDSNAANNSASDVDTVIFVADVQVIKTNNRVVSLPGNPVTYTITVINQGPSTVNYVTVTDALPATLLNPVFTPSVGVYNSENGVWNALYLQAGQSAVLTVTATLSASATGTLVNTATISLPGGVTDPNPNDDSSTDTDSIGYTISGAVYSDVDHNSQRNANEGGLGVANLYAKLVSGTNALQAVTVSNTGGTYTFTNVSPGTYTVILDNNATTGTGDTTEYRPADWVGTENPTQRVTNVVLSNTNVTDINIGLWHGSTISGTVFKDTGGASANANNGTQNAGEIALVAIEVRATNAAGTTNYDVATTNAAGAYTLWVPYLTTPATVLVREFNLDDYVSTGGSAGTTTGSGYARATDTTTVTFANGAAYTGVNFADVPANLFTIDGIKSATPGSVVFYPHVFTAGTNGQVTFSTVSTPTPNIAGWTVILYRDTNGNGAVDPAETPLTGTQTVNPGDVIAMVLKVFVPENAPEGANDSLVIAAAFTYTNASPALNTTVNHVDLTTVSAVSNLRLTLSVDKAVAASTDELVYTITYTNVGAEPLRNVVVNNATPAFTTFVSAAYGTLPPNLTACTIAVPAVGATGGLSWSFTGDLAPGSSGTVIFRVKVQ
jgi:uncharacterized repeat protein (TIGR01451 family)